MRMYESGSTRDSAEGKFDYEGFLSPLVLRSYAAYMHQHRKQSDGEMRPADNWQKGISRDDYMSSLWRHFMDAWTLHRGHEVTDPKGNPVDMESALNGVLFNAMGYLFEELRKDLSRSPQPRPA